MPLIWQYINGDWHFYTFIARDIFNIILVFNLQDLIYDQNSLYTMVDSLCKDGNYWSVPGNDSGKKPSRLSDRRRGQWHIRNDLHWKQYLVMLIKTQTVQLTRWETSELFHTCHTVIGMISARPLQRIWEGDVLLAGPDPFQLGQGG